MIELTAALLKAITLTAIGFAISLVVVSWLMEGGTLPN